MTTENQFIILVGEHYLYCEEPYQVIDIAMDTVQLRSLNRYSHIAFKSVERLQRAWQHGNLRRISEAPLAGAQNRIVDSLSEKERAQLERRRAYVTSAQAEFFGKLPVEQTKLLIREVSLRIGDPQPPSYETLYIWNRNFKNSGGTIVCLIPKTKKHQKRIDLQPEEVRTIIIKTLSDQYFTRPHANKTDVIDAIRSHLKMLNQQRVEHLKIPSIITLWRIISEFDTYETELHQRGFKYASRRQKWSKKAQTPKHLLDRIECDTHLIDLELVDKEGNNIGRAYLTVALEIVSRHIVGYDLSLNYPSIEKTIRAIKMSLSDRYTYNGLGKTYIVDNGAEYAGAKLSDCLHLLGSRVVFCEPGSPDQKPHVERWFKTFAVQLPHIMKGTTYSNIAERGDYNSKKKPYTLLNVYKNYF
jgi:putative transposase